MSLIVATLPMERCRATARTAACLVRVARALSEVVLTLGVGPPKLNQSATLWLTWFIVNNMLFILGVAPNPFEVDLKPIEAWEDDSLSTKQSF